jgi:hypothetical protein
MTQSYLWKWVFTGLAICHEAFSHISTHFHAFLHIGTIRESFIILCKFSKSHKHVVIYQISDCKQKLFILVSSIHRREDVHWPDECLEKNKLWIVVLCELDISREPVAASIGEHLNKCDTKVSVAEIELEYAFHTCEELKSVSSLN